MKHSFLVTVDTGSDSVLDYNKVKELIEGNLIDAFDEVNRDKWNHKLPTDIEVTYHTPRENKKLLAIQEEIERRMVDMSVGEEEYYFLQRINDAILNEL